MPKKSFFTIHFAPTKKPRFSYDPNAKGEVMPSHVRWYDAPLQTTLDYLNGDIHPILERSHIKSPTKQYTQFKFFGRTLHDMLGAEASKVANLILHARGKDIKKVLALISKNPMLLHIETSGIDPLRRCVKGTLLQIAAMARDIDLKKDIRNQKQRGLLAKLIAAGHLSQEEITKQLACITSEKAQKINLQRKQRILAAIKRFGERVIYTDTAGMCFQAYQAHCQPWIDQLEKDLQTEMKKTITAGYIFDPEILHDTAIWIIHEMHQCSSDQRDVLWVNGFGKLQSMLSSRDAQVLKAGIKSLVEEGIIPKRTVRDPDGWSYFFNPDSDLGREVYLGYFGLAGRGDLMSGQETAEAFRRLSQVQTAELKNLCHYKSTEMKLRI